MFFAYLVDAMNTEEQNHISGSPAGAETCEHYVRFLLEMTGYDFDLTARILNILRNVPARELRKQIQRSFLS